MNIVALIPARAGSKRIPGKNTKLLGGKPLIQWTIEAAEASRVFSTVNVCTDSNEIACCVGYAPIIWRDKAPDSEPDIVWVHKALEHFSTKPDAFAILRPTSPFRTADTIRRAFQAFKDGACSSIRAVEPVKQHPGKMWQERYGRIEPLIRNEWPGPFGEASMYPGSTPWHSQPTQSLPTVYVQNSSLEMAWTWCVTHFDTISGPKVAPFFTEGWEGFSIDYPEDWERAEAHAATLAKLQTTPTAQ